MLLLVCLLSTGFKKVTSEIGTSNPLSCSNWKANCSLSTFSLCPSCSYSISHQSLIYYNFQSVNSLSIPMATFSLDYCPLKTESLCYPGRNQGNLSKIKVTSLFFYSFQVS